MSNPDKAHDQQVLIVDIGRITPNKVDKYYDGATKIICSDPEFPLERLLNLNEEEFIRSVLEAGWRYHMTWIKNPNTSAYGVYIYSITFTRE